MAYTQQKKICLLVEDDIDDQELFDLCLKKTGKNVICSKCNNGAEALNLLKSDPDYVPDVIFLDVNMPKMNGLECLQKIREMTRFNNTRIFVYSTTSDNMIEKKSKDLGAQGFIAKTTRLEELIIQLEGIFASVETM
ncbi:MAG: response regulator receiver protein [Bacteroidetes bacterium]|jgi:CheY-like chemotaxis protein|nr:response regulator receiver protein [Bacteroidota bacterium]